MARTVNGIEGVDYVVCRECGHQSAKLYRHVESHGLDARGYTTKYGEDAPLRCAKNIEKQGASRTVRFNALPKVWKEAKEIVCPGCGTPHQVAKSFAFSVHDPRCPKCKSSEVFSTQMSLYAGKAEGQDYVVCFDCGYPSENLSSHVTNAHPGYQERHPGAQVVALGSAVRDKTLLQGKTLSDETKTLMSENAGRWNAGLTKETDARVAASAEKMKGRVSWSRGLTKETDHRLIATAEAMTAWMAAHPEHGAKHAAALTPEDFEPYLEADGTVDMWNAEEGLKFCHPTLLKYMRDLGLATSDKYRQAHAVRQVIRLERDVLLGYSLGNGKVSIGAAMAGTGHAFTVIARECKRHGLPTFHRRIRQTLCLDAVSKALGGVPFVQEWRRADFTNHKTNHRFKFDGYYESLNLIVEFHGNQHYTFPNAYMLDESYRPMWEEGQWRDEEKVRLATSAGIHYLVVLESEPFTDPLYLAGRLVQMGVLEPGEFKPLDPVSLDGDVLDLFG